MADRQEKTPAPEAGTETAATEAPKSSGGMKKILIIGLVIVADLAIMAALAVFIVGRLKAGDPVDEAVKEQHEVEKKVQAKNTVMGSVLTKPLNLTVNIGGPSGAHYLKCAVQLEWDEKEHPKLGLEIDRRLPKITDMIINILSSQSIIELLKPSGKQRIRDGIISEVNSAIPKEFGEVRNAFFTEFLVQ